MPCSGSKNLHFSKDMACSGNEEKTIEIPLISIFDTFLFSKFSFKVIFLVLLTLSVKDNEFKDSCCSVKIDTFFSTVLGYVHHRMKAACFL